jgi:hypothetical protein
MDAANDRPQRYECTIAGRDLQEELTARTRPYLIACSSFLRQLAYGWERRRRMAGVTLFELHAVPEEQTGLSLREALVAYVRETLGP